MPRGDVLATAGLDDIHAAHSGNHVQSCADYGTVAKALLFLTDRYFFPIKIVYNSLHVAGGTGRDKVVQGLDQRR
jgi:hypothetical protein